jgi:hypothetical protein
MSGGITQAKTNQTTPRRHVIGLDLGQSSDPSALVVVEDSLSWLSPDEGFVSYYAVRHARRWPLKTKYPEIVADVAAVVRSPKVRDPLLVIDGTGVGAAVGDMFADADLGDAAIRRVVITAGHRAHRDEAGVWMVPKKALVSVLQVLLQSKRLAIAKVPDREVLVRELMNFRVKISPAMNELYGAWREGQHDDLVLATALACWAAEGTASRFDADVQPIAFGGRGEPCAYVDRGRGIDHW